MVKVNNFGPMVVSMKGIGKIMSLIFMEELSMNKEWFLKVSEKKEILQGLG